MPWLGFGFLESRRTFLENARNLDGLAMDWRRHGFDSYFCHSFFFLFFLFLPPTPSGNMPMFSEGTPNPAVYLISFGLLFLQLSNYSSISVL